MTNTFGPRFHENFQELEIALHNWRNSISDKPVAAPHAASSLYSKINEIACQYGVIGGAFGIINTQTKKIELKYSYDDSQNNEGAFSLFNYKIPNSLALRKLDFSSHEEVSKWMHELFDIERNAQRIEEAEGVILPEVFTAFTAKPSALDYVPFLHKSHEEIRKTICLWIRYWGYAFASQNAGVAAPFSEIEALSKNSK